MFKSFFLSVMVLCLSSTVTLGQRSVRDLRDYMASVKQTPHQPIPESVLSDVNSSSLMDVLVELTTDSAELVRSKSYYIIKRVGQRSTNTAISQRAIHALTLAIREKNSGISGMATEALTGFKKQNFPEVDRDSIGRYIRADMAHLDEIVKLAGYLELQTYQNAVRSITTSNLGFKYKWAARLALARMGDAESITYLRSKLSQAVVNDDFVYDVVPDLVYTRQKEIFEYLHAVINSDKQDCSSSDPDSNAKTICAYRVIELVAPSIVGFPARLDETGNLDTNDYKATLSIVRSWFAQNTDYTLLKDAY